MKVIFVGVHHKKGFAPLDSLSLSGKRVDAIAKAAGLRYWHKTNLFNAYTVPNERAAKNKLIEQFTKEEDIETEDIVVLLGHIVQYEFPEIPCIKIRVAHPSLQYSKTKPEDYIETVANQIKLKLQL